MLEVQINSPFISFQFELKFKFTFARRREERKIVLPIRATHETFALKSSQSGKTIFADKEKSALHYFILFFSKHFDPDDSDCKAS